MAPEVRNGIRPLMSERRPPTPDAKTSLRRFLLEIGPLAVFFFTYIGWDRVFPPSAPPAPGVLADSLLAATAVLMAAVVVSLGLSYKWERREPLMPLVTA